MAGAQQELADSDPLLDEPVPIYRIELVVFENLSANARSEDPDRPPLPPPMSPDDWRARLADPLDRVPDPRGDRPPEDAVPDSIDQPPDARPEGEDRAQDEALVQNGSLDQEEPEPLFYLPVDEFELDELVARLRRSAGYRPLLHEGWTQPGVDRELTEAVPLEQLAQLRRALLEPDADPPPVPVKETASASEESEATLEGAVRLYRSRFLHLEIELALPRENDPALRLVAKRRVRSGELHFFDAPALGAVALVTPVELDSTEATEATDEGDAATGQTTEAAVIQSP